MVSTAAVKPRFDGSISPKLRFEKLYSGVGTGTLVPGGGTLTRVSSLPLLLLFFIPAAIMIGMDASAPCLSAELKLPVKLSGPEISCGGFMYAMKLSPGSLRPPPDPPSMFRRFSVLEEPFVP